MNYILFNALLLLTTAGCTHGTVRLIGGAYSFEGRVEVCVNGLWGSVCHDFWSTTDAAVVCRQFGYSTYGMEICDSNHEEGGHDHIVAAIFTVLMTL